MGNFIDKTFTVIADILLKILPASKQEKQAFSYYRAGMAAQGKGRYAEALRNYYEALQVEESLPLCVFFLVVATFDLVVLPGFRVS